MSRVANSKDTFSPRADNLRHSILIHLWNPTEGVMRMSDIASPTGICQDINAYAITTGLSPTHPAAETTLAAPRNDHLPLAFQGLARWEDKRVVSPYASGFAVEALFERGHGSSAVELIKRVWGVMADETNPNYSGGHWEAMKPDGTPITDDTSLMHGWSTWPVYLLPRYLAGVSPLEPGWTRWKVQPVLAGLENVEVALSTPAGRVEISLDMQESIGTGSIVLRVPTGSVAEVFAPRGWSIKTAENPGQRSSASQVITGQNGKVTVRIQKYSEKAAPTTVKAEKNGVASSEPSVVVPGKVQASGWYGWLRQFSILRLLLKWLG